MRLENARWPQVEEYFKTNDTVLLSIGSVESHGKHLPLGTDTLIPTRLLEMIEDRTSVLMTPVLPFGACESLATFPGTINLGSDLLYQLLSQVCNELYRHGARHFIVLNGHGGNIKTIDRVGIDLRAKGALLAELNWWLMAWDMNPAWKGGHGGGEETAAILGIDPSLVDKSLYGGELELRDVSADMKATGFNTVEFQGVTVNIIRYVDEITDSGWIGPDHPSTATEEWGRDMLEATANYLVDFVDAFGQVPLE